MKKGTVAGIVLLIMLFSLSIFIVGKAAGFNTPNPEITKAHEIVAICDFYDTQDERVKLEILKYVGKKYKDFDTTSMFKADWGENDPIPAPTSYYLMFLEAAKSEASK